MPNYTGRNRTPDNIREKVATDWVNGERNKTQLARKYGLDIGTVDRIVRKLDAPPSQEPTSDHPRAVKETGYVDEPTVFRENGDEATYSGVTTEPIKTLEDALRVAEIDQTVWYVDRWETSNWTVPMMVKNGQSIVELATYTENGEGKEITEALKWNPTNPIRTQQYRVKLYLKRLMKRSLQEAHNAIFDRLLKYSPDYKPYTYKPRPEEPHLAVMGLFDVHFGKLAWDQETGENYDLRIAERVFSNAVDDLIRDAMRRNIVQWLFPLGNDFYHMDNMYNTTTNGTPQDVDGRYAKIIEIGEMAVINAVEKMLKVAPVEVKWIPGNHDFTTSYHLTRTIHAWFRKTKDVSVDYSPMCRKYYHWGVTLLGLTHGNEEKKETLPSIMSTEKPQEWAATTCHEWLLGHDHRSQKWMTQPVGTYEGTTVRTLKSLARTDRWHFKKAYVGGAAAGENYYYGEKQGYHGHWVAPARED